MTHTLRGPSLSVFGNFHHLIIATSLSPLECACSSGADRSQPIYGYPAKMWRWFAIDFLRFFLGGLPSKYSLVSEIWSCFLPLPIPSCRHTKTVTICSSELTEVASILCAMPFLKMSGMCQLDGQARRQTSRETDRQIELYSNAFVGFLVVVNRIVFPLTLFFLIFLLCDL